MRNMVYVAALVVLVSAQVASACAGCGCATKKTAPPETSTEICTAELQTVVSAKKSVTILDARSGKWDDGRRIPGAKSLGSEVSAKRVTKLIPSKDAAIVTYCSSLKCGASKALAQKLRKLGYTNVREYAPGIKGWVDAGNKIDNVN